jgi:hypothetical protein
MPTLALHDIEPELLEELARRAKCLGSTIEREALRALREHLAEPEVSPPGAGLPQKPRAEGSPVQTLPDDPRFVRKNGVWVFTGQLDPSLIPDHREIREERLDSFVKAAVGESGD